MNLNQKIVSVHEKVELCTNEAFNDSVRSLLLPLSFFVMSFSGFLAMLIKESLSKDLYEPSLMFLLASILSAISWKIFKKEAEFIDGVYFYLHYIFPGYNKRKREICAYIEANKVRPDRFITDSVFDDLTVDNLHEWLKVNVSETKSILTLCHQRALTKTNELDMDFLYWTQLVPKVANVDVYKILLLTSKFSSYLEFEYAAKFTVKDVTKAFSNYSENDILRFFTSPLSMQDYIQTLTCFNSELVPFKVEHRLSDLFQGLQYKYEDEFKLGSLGELEIEGFVLKQCLTAVALDDLSTYMKNCLMSRKTECQKGTSFIYTLNREGLPYIVFELNKRGRLVEAKKRFNQMLSGGETQLVKSIITIMGKKA